MSPLSLSRLLQFRSLADQLYRNPELHDVVRSRVVAHLRAHRNVYAMYVPGSFEQYCNDMALPTTWGDHVTLKAAAGEYSMKHGPV